MRFQYRVGIGLVAISWFATGMVWWARQNAAAHRQDWQMQGDSRIVTGSGPMNGDAIRRTWPILQPAMRRQVIEAISAQLTAFRKDDYATALRFQSQGLRRQFANAAGLRELISKQYPQFAKSQTAWFGRGRIDPATRRIVIFVEVTGQDGQTVRAVYSMVREGKQYCVDGVSLRSGGGPGPGNGGGNNNGRPPIRPQPKPITSPGQEA